MLASSTLSPELRLSSYVAGAEASRIPESVRERARIHILDTFGAMVSGSQLKPGRLVRSFVETQGGVPESSVVLGTRTTAILAALANAVMAHADETDDAHFGTVSHPGSVIVPSALAVAERQHRPGAELVEAVVLGYDVMCRMIKALDRAGMSRQGLHAPSMAGGFGAAATCARLLGLDVAQTNTALAFAGTQASGLTTWRQDPEHVDKALCFAGVPARNGVTSALWAHAGLTATATIFTGPDNVFRAFSERWQLEELTAELGERFEVLDTSIKKYPTGQPVQAALEGYFQLLEQHAITGNDVRRVRIALPEIQAHTVNERLMPDVNGQYLLAVALLDGEVSFESAHSFERMHDPRIVAAKQRVEIVGDPELSRVFPASRPARVEIDTLDGRHLVVRVDRVPGAPDRPLTWGEAERKFLSLCEPVLGRATAQEFAERIHNLDTIADAAELGDLVRQRTAS